MKIEQAPRTGLVYDTGGGPMTGRTVVRPWQKSGLGGPFNVAGDRGVVGAGGGIWLLHGDMQMLPAACCGRAFPWVIGITLEELFNPLHESDRCPAQRASVRATYSSLKGYVVNAESGTPSSVPPAAEIALLGLAGTW